MIHGILGGATLLFLMFVGWVIWRWETRGEDERNRTRPA